MSNNSLKAPRYYRDPEEGYWSLSIDGLWVQIYMSDKGDNEKEKLFPMKYNGRTYESYKHDKDFDYEKCIYQLLIQETEKYKKVLDQKDIVGLSNAKNIAKEFLRERILVKLKKIESFFE